MELKDSRMLRAEEIKIIQELTDKELVWLRERIGQFSCLSEAIRAMAKTSKEGGGCHTQKRVEKILSILNMYENPATSMEDTVGDIVRNETALLGISITCHSVDAKDQSDVNCSCKEFVNGKILKDYWIMGEIKSFRTFKVKKGKNAGSDMGYLSIDDGTATLNDMVIFCEAYAQFKHLLVEGDVLLFSGYRDKNKHGFIVNSVFQTK